jgi:autotransporter translocation and assembly factor TamB
MLRNIAQQTWLTTLRILLILFVLFTLFVAVTLGTEGGRITLVKQSLQILNVAQETSIELKGIRSPSLGSWRIEQLLVNDETGAARLRIRGLKIDWNWYYALQNRWWFNEIQLNALTVFRSTEEASGSPAETLAELYRYWPQVPAIRVDAVAVDQLRIEHADLPAFQSGLSGQLELNWGALPARFLLALTDELNDNYFAAELSADAIDYFQLSGRLSAKADSAWSKWLQWNLAEPVDARWDVGIDYSEPGFFNLAINEWIMPWKTHQITANGALRYDIDQAQMQFLPLNVVLDEKPAELDGWLGRDESDLHISVNEWDISPFAEFLGQNDVHGQATVDATVLGGWRRPLVEAQLNAHGQWAKQPFQLEVISTRSGKKVTLRKAELLLVNNRIEASGLVDWLTDELQLTYHAELSTDPVLRAILPPALSDVQASGTLSGTITGAIDDPVITADAGFEGFWQKDAMKGQVQAQWQDGALALTDLFLYSDLLQAKGDFDWQVDSNEWNAHLDIAEWRTDSLSRIGIELPVDVSGSGYGHLDISAVAAQFRISGLMNIQGQWQQWPINAELNLDELTPQYVRFGDSRIQLAEGEAIANGGVNWSQQTLDLHLDHQQLLFDVLPPWFSQWPSLLQSLQGSLTGHTDITGPWTKPAIATVSRFTGQWFDEPLELDLAVEPSTNLLWQISQLDARWLGGRWQYQGQFRPYELLLDGHAEVDQLNNRYLPLLSNAFLGNEKQLPDNMDLDFAAEMEIQGHITEPVLVGSLSSRGQVDSQPFVLDADVNYLDTHHMVIRQAKGLWASGDWALSGSYDWHEGEVIMSIDTNTPDAKHLVPWLQLFLGSNPNFRWLESWQGSLNGHLALDNRFDRWTVQGNLDSEGLLMQQPYELTWLGEGELQNQLNHQFEGYWGDAEVSSSLISGNQLLTGNIEVNDLNFDQIGLFVDAVPADMTGSLNADIAVAGEIAQPIVNARIEADGYYQQHPFNANLLLQGNASGWEISQTQVVIPGALELFVKGQGQQKNGSVQLQANFTDIQYWWPDSALGAGKATLSLTASGDLSAPELSGSFRWLPEEWPLTVESTLATHNGEYQLEASLLSDGETRLKAGIKAPVTSLIDGLDDLVTQPMDIRLSMDMPLSVLDPFFVNQPDQKLSGTIRGDISLSGSLSDPVWQGKMAWLNGGYEHVQFGSRIADIGIVLQAEDKQWQISGTATDAASGRILIDGSVNFFSSQTDALVHNISLTTSFDNAKLINQAQMDAILTGDLNLLGSYHGLLVSGDLVVPQFNMQTDSLLSDGAPQLNIVTEETDAAELNVSRFYWPQGEWDVILQADQRANLYGQGINAELSGQFAVSGDLYSPVLAGQFELVRGTYVGFGKVFTLTEGSVQMQSSQLTLDIEGEYSSDDLDVTLEITGTQDELSLSLTSDSTDGQDELLALLLFGESVEDMSVFQAIQLANALNKLRTGDSGLDIVGSARDDLSLDSLVIDTDSDDDGNLTFNVSAGKYINDFLYLEVEQDVGSDQEFRSSLQYRLTNQTYLEFYTQGDFGQFDENGIELNWSWDY